jgi:preprotein translocase subunit YajC
VDPSILLLVVSVGLLVLLTMNRRRQQRDAQTMQSRLAVGSEVMTGSGMFATVVELEDGVVVLETAPGQTSRWDRRAVTRVVSTPQDVDGPEDDPDDDVEPADVEPGAAGTGEDADDSDAAPSDAERRKDS